MASHVAARPFDKRLFETIPFNLLPDLHVAKKMREGTGTAYAVIEDSQGAQQLGIGVLKQSEPLGGISLKEISRFVRGVLADKGKLDGAVAGKNFDERVYLYLNLKKIGSYIESRNERSDASLCWVCQTLHVILLVLTLGLFSYKKQFHIEGFRVLLQDLGAKKEQLVGAGFGRLSLLHLVSMGDADRKLILEKMDLLGKWDGFAGKHSDLIERLAALPEKALALLSLEELQKKDDLADSPLGLLYKSERELKEEVVGEKTSRAEATLLAKLLDKLSPIEATLHLEGGVDQWKKLPFDQLLRMEKEQFVTYAASFPEHGAPQFGSCFPWSVRKHLLETSKTLKEGQLSCLVDTPSSMRDQHALNSFIERLPLELQQRAIW